MINKIFLKILTFLINLIDLSNKKKIINFFKKQFDHRKLNIFDIGCHKGETIELLSKNFNINKIYAFEPNIKLFELLKKKNYDNKITLINAGVGLNEKPLDLNIMVDSSSSTFNNINSNTKYYKRKNKIITFFSKKKGLIENKQRISIINLSNFFLKHKLDNIDILKIDTEGFEYNILKGLNNIDFQKIKFIYFEHHYDLMIDKGYNFHDVNQLLIMNNFQKKYKLKMKFRKSFEYIYENKKKSS